MIYKEQLKKISECEFELPKTGRMLVPGKIFISEKMLEIVEESAIKQVANVAMLPGIVKYSIAMPDIHSGYGFPIGGVAAFDIEKGIISPGGVGYDINCLTGDVKILTEFGSSIKIKDFNKMTTETEINSYNRKLKKIRFCTLLPTLNLTTKNFENKQINLFMCRDADNIYELTLNSGLKIKATAEHPFLTKFGMERMADLSEDEEIAVNLFEGVVYSCNSFCKTNEKQAILAKVLGYLFGDGTLYVSKNKKRAIAYGSREDLLKMKEDLGRIGVHSSLFFRTRNHLIKTKYGLFRFKATNHELHIYTKEFIETLIKAGMPIGNKTRQKIRIPEWIKKSDKLIKRLFLAGFFGAELSSPKTHTKTGFYSPILSQNKIASLSQNAREFFIDLLLMLEEFEIKTNKISEAEDFYNKYEEKTKRFRLIISADEDNLLKLWRTIGFEYNKKKQQLANIACLYILLKKQENKRRQEIARKIKEYKSKGFKLREVQKIFEKEINLRFIERHYYKTSGQRINLDFISFLDFKKQKLAEIKNFGTIFDKVESIAKLKGTHKVYDFNIQDNHNFIANGFIVSNCGVRLLSTNIPVSEFMKKRKEVLHSIFRSVPSGVGRGGEKYSKEEVLQVLKEGAEWALKKGFGTKEDLEHTEENGRMSPANPEDVSQKAIARGLPQLGTLGAGNHFLEIQKVDQIYNEEIAKEFGINPENITVMIHCGSRGLGHQVASDYIRLMENKYGWKDLPDRELINAPIKSELGKKYLSAMNCAVNFAFCNRQMIMHHVRKQLLHYFPRAEVRLVYDVAHNIAKLEEHIVDGKKMKLCVHRKGATRSFGPGRKELPEIYRKIGQPVLIPGSMGTASYVLVGTKKAEEISFGSTAHGSGRVESRTKARKELRAEEIKKELESKDIVVEAGSYRGLVEEAPEAYKDIDEVVAVSNKIGIGNLVARLVPLAVMKG